MLVLPAALAEDGVQVGRRDGLVDPVEELAQGARDQAALAHRGHAVRGRHEGVDVEHQGALLGHGDGCQQDVAFVGLAECHGVVAQIGLQFGQALGIVDEQRQLRSLVETGLDEQVTVGAIEVRGSASSLAGL